MIIPACHGETVLSVELDRKSGDLLRFTLLPVIAYREDESGFQPVSVAGAVDLKATFSGEDEDKIAVTLLHDPRSGLWNGHIWDVHVGANLMEDLSGGVISFNIKDLRSKAALYKIRKEQQK